MDLIARAALVDAWRRSRPTTPPPTPPSRAQCYLNLDLTPLSEVVRDDGLCLDGEVYDYRRVRIFSMHRDDPTRWIFEYQNRADHTFRWVTVDLAHPLHTLRLWEAFQRHVSRMANRDPSRFLVGQRAVWSRLVEASVWKSFHENP